MKTQYRVKKVTIGDGNPWYYVQTKGSTKSEDLDSSELMILILATIVTGGLIWLLYFTWQSDTSYGVETRFKTYEQAIDRIRTIDNNRRQYLNRVKPKKTVEHIPVTMLEHDNY